MLVLAALIVCCFFVWHSYEADYKISEIGREGSPDDRTMVIFQMLGKPGTSIWDLSRRSGRVKGRIIVERDVEEIKRKNFRLENRGGPLQKDNWEVAFYPAGLEIIFRDLAGGMTAAGDSGNREEKISQDMVKDDKHIVVYYDEALTFSGNREQEIVVWSTDRYDNRVFYLDQENDKYIFQEDEFPFSVNNDFWRTDDHGEAKWIYFWVFIL